MRLCKVDFYLLGIACLGTLNWLSAMQQSCESLSECALRRKSFGRNTGSSSGTKKEGLVVFTGLDAEEVFPLRGQVSNEERGRIYHHFGNPSNIPSTLNDKKIAYDIEGLCPYVSVVCAGPLVVREFYYPNENIRAASAAATRQLIAAGVSKIYIDPIEEGNLQSAIEGAILSGYNYKDWRNLPRVALFRAEAVSAELQQKALQAALFAHAQNFARYLSDLPANLCTPTYFAAFMQKFANDTVQPFLKRKSLSVEVYDRAWAVEKGLGLFLSVNNGSAQDLKFVAMEYNGALENNIPSDGNARPIVFVGKGITFDSGGISLKAKDAMKHMMADMEGAAIVSMSFLAAVISRAPIHLVCLTPLTENLPSGSSTKPGDVVRAGNGLTVEITNTDAEGRLVLADAFTLAATYNPELILDVATLTGAIGFALGSHASGMYSRSDVLAQELIDAGLEAGDRLWRMPLFKEYRSVLDSNVADLKNSHLSSTANSCVAANFMSAFIPEYIPWIHLDIAGTMHTDKEVGALSPGMTGRPTRALLYWLVSHSK